MSLDTSISNVGEYYSSHYLSSFFAKDIKKLVAQWKEQGASSTPSKIRQLSQTYFKEKNLALDEPDQQDRLNLAGFHAHLLEALGYTDRKSREIFVEGGATIVPSIARVTRYNSPWLVICETGFCLPDSSLPDGGPSEDPLSSIPVKGQVVDPENTLCPGDWERLVGKIFTREASPRWILFLGGSQALLLDRHTWSQGRYLAFDFDDAFGRNEKATFDHFAAFLSRETLCPSGDSDDILHDTLEEQSHKFAHGVTDQLQVAVREAIGLLANEWVQYRREKNLSYTRLGTKERPFPDGSTDISAEILRRESLIFVYRLLFCFYAEARGGELGILPINDDVYKLGYSLESLRDLENVPLTPASEKGIYFHQHLKILFKIIHEGFNPIDSDDLQNGALNFNFGDQGNFSISPLTATLFDPDSLYLLDKAVLSNRCLQQVIKRLSLSAGERSKEIGRVNYAELGINQLGAVYEGLLSYKGMFADKDLIQVKPANKKWTDKKTPTWFVDAARIDEFKKDEIEQINRKPRIYPKGSFILHLSGIDREQSASYYTPEVLTKCLVEEALRELLKDYQPQDADKILDLKICEPAMGSGAFLNEATLQLGEKYLELKQEEINQHIEPARYQDELRRVQHYISTRNVYGVDLNATAVELGALSLWLGSIHRLLVKEGKNGQPDIHKPGSTPWFGLRLRCGNSLIGARRSVWTKVQLKKGQHFGSKSAVPRLLKPGEKRKKDEIYHFLVFDEDMVPTHKDGLMKKFYLDDCDDAKAWIAREVKTKWDEEDISRAIEVSKRIDDHWIQYAEQRATALEQTLCTASVWPVSSGSKEALAKGPSLQQQEEIKQQLEATSGSFQRLKLIMDTWCSLWFWPLDQTKNLPRRTSFLEAAKILLGDKPPVENLQSFLSTVFNFDIKGLFDAAKEDVPDTEVLSGIVSWYGLGREISEQQKFHHWELIFTEVLGPIIGQGGFDLVLGNPPWMSVAWEIKTIVGEFDIHLALSSTRKADFENALPNHCRNKNILKEYTKFFLDFNGIHQFLTSNLFYSALKGSKGNLFKNFVCISWQLISDNGFVALLHPQGVFDEEKAGILRAEYYLRLKKHFQFRNELLLFKDIGNSRDYAINISGKREKKPKFIAIFQLYHPTTIKHCMVHTVHSDPIPLSKNDDGQFQTRGHKLRIIDVDIELLKVFNHLIEKKTTGILKTKLPKIYSQHIDSVISKFVEIEKHLKNFSGKFTFWEGIDESSAVNSQILERIDAPPFEPTKIEEFVFVGPHFYVANPYKKSPQTTCKTHRSFFENDLQNIDDNFIPNSVFKILEDSNKCEIKKYRHLNRCRIDTQIERSLIACIIPPFATHIDSGYSLNFSDERTLLLFNGLCASICYDFFIKIIGKSHCRIDLLSMLPYVDCKYSDSLILRNLRLNVLTKDYSRLWELNFIESFKNDRWTTNDQRIRNNQDSSWNNLQKKWYKGIAFCNDYNRRQSLLEIDVLSALSIGLSLEELITIYRIQFPVMRGYELVDQYDQQGKRIPNTKRKDPGAIQFRESLKDWDDESPLTVSWEIDNGLQTVTKTFYPPFEGVDREKDYEIAYHEFKKRYGNEK